MTRKNPFKTAVIALALGGLSLFAQAETPDEAKQLLDKAVALIKAKGKDAAISEFNAGGAWKKGSLYLVMGQLDGLVLAHSANDKIPGKNMSGAKDASGKEFVQENLSQLKTKGVSEVNMRWANPNTKQIGDAVMFSRTVPGTELYVSSIVFK